VRDPGHAREVTLHRSLIVKRLSRWRRPH
jgi:hypothetical protein